MRVETKKSRAELEKASSNLELTDIGIKYGPAGLQLIEQLFLALQIPQATTSGERKTKMKAALDLLRHIKPSDPLESMLATQMVATHSAAMDCFRRAVNLERDAPGADLHLKQAIKLMQLYTGQFATLDVRRGKGRQQVSVEHVHVEAGGQAVLGNFKSGTDNSNPAKAATSAEKAISITPRPTLDVGNVTRTRSKQRKS